MAIGVILEPGVVVSLLAGGTLVNRNRNYNKTTSIPARRDSWDAASPPDSDYDHDYDDFEAKSAASEGPDSSLSRPKPWDVPSHNSSTSTLVYEGLVAESTNSRWRQRTIRFMGWEYQVTSPNTEIHKDRFLSRLLRQFPFLVEVWYWALIYWVYQLGRAFTAVTLQLSTVDTARKHALQVIHLEQRLHMFVEGDIQQYFLQYPSLMRAINRVYSFIHIPGTILFLIVLFYLTTTRPRQKFLESQLSGLMPRNWVPPATHFGPSVYERRRRTMAMCNLLAFIVFTLWPCMPPRLLSDPNYNGEDATESKSYGFVDTVHGADGDSSVWTTNKFCNQYAAMPSLHFGYSFLIGLTVATVPMRKTGRMAWKRITAVCVGMLYPAIILTAIVSTANHFILDAVAGAIACGIAWRYNHVLLNLLAVEDYFLHVVRIHKP